MQKIKGTFEMDFSEQEKENEDIEFSKLSKELLGGGEYPVEIEYNLLETTRDTAGEIIQFLIAYHNFKSGYFDWDND